jgi:arginyl-tRNA synthetase
MTDYVFDWDKMLSLTGDTAPYLQYSHVRARSIFRKLGEPMPETTGLVLADAAERALALKLCQFSEAVPDVLADHRPNILANYLLELARQFHSFFEACPVLRAEGETRLARLALCELTARTLKTGLDLMGIEAPERM